MIPVAERPISIHKTPRTDQGAEVGVAGGPACRKVPRTGASRRGQYDARQADDSMRGHGLDGGRGSCRIAPRGRRRPRTASPYNEELVKAGVLLAAEGPQPSSKGARIGHAAKLDRRLKIVKYGSTSKGGS